MKSFSSISYRQLSLIFASIGFGAIATLFFSHDLSQNSTSFTPVELIGFVLSVILSGASIVLAITAIGLGRSSELVLTSRSDEQIRLQNNIYKETIEALHSIKSSTGVTEKRIEDIISGRAGEWSRQIAEMASDESKYGSLDVDKLQEKIKGSIIKNLNAETRNTVWPSTEKDQKSIEIDRKYREKHDKLIYGIANKKNVEVEKLGHGSPSKKSPKERFDAIYRANNSLYALSTLTPMEFYEQIGPSFIRSDVIRPLAIALKELDIQKLYIIQFVDGVKPMKNSRLQDELSLLSDEFKQKIDIVELNYEDIDTWTQELVFN